MIDSMDENAPRKRVQHEIGQDLAPLSLEEIDSRIVLLKAEIARLEAQRVSKQASRAAAELFFKPEGHSRGGAG